MGTRRSHQVLRTPALMIITMHPSLMATPSRAESLWKQTHHWHSVGDEDDFWLHHTPAFGWRWLLKVRRVTTRRKGGLPYHSYSIPHDDAVFWCDRFEKMLRLIVIKTRSSRQGQPLPENDTQYRWFTSEMGWPPGQVRPASAPKLRTMDSINLETGRRTLNPSHASS